jgi:hypothetical protein
MTCPSLSQPQRNWRPWLAEALLLMLAFCLCVAWSEAIDPRQMRELGAFSWDQIRYKEIFDQLLRGSQ